jgi:hypothetical protein
VIGLHYTHMPSWCEIGQLYLHLLHYWFCCDNVYK